MSSATRVPNLLWIAHWATSIFSIGRCPPSSRRRDPVVPVRLTPIERLGAFLFRVNWTNRTELSDFPFGLGKMLPLSPSSPPALANAFTTQEFGGALTPSFFRHPHPRPLAVERDSPVTFPYQELDHWAAFGLEQSFLI